MDTEDRIVVTRDVSGSLGLTLDYGHGCPRIARVVAGGPAEAAMIRAGDRLTAFVGTGGQLVSLEPDAVEGNRGRLAELLPRGAGARCALIILSGSKAQAGVDADADTDASIRVPRRARKFKPQRLPQADDDTTEALPTQSSISSGRHQQGQLLLLGATALLLLGLLGGSMAMRSGRVGTAGHGPAHTDAAEAPPRPSLPPSQPPPPSPLPPPPCQSPPKPTQPTPSLPPPPPSPPPSPPPLSPLERINGRFARGVPSNDPAAAGVIIHQVWRANMTGP